MFKTFKKNTLGYYVTGLGALLLSVENVFIKILGAILTVTGGILIYNLNQQESVADKAEIIERIEHFSRKIKLIKAETENTETADKVIEVQQEFDDWANNFKKNYVEKKLELTRTNLEGEKIKIELSKDFRYIYVAFLYNLKNLIVSYNQIATSKIQIVSEKDLPFNLFSKEASEFYWKIKFNPKHFWYLLLDISGSIDNKELPTIVLDTKSDDYKNLAYSKLSGKRFNINQREEKIFIGRLTDNRICYALKDYDNAFKITLKDDLELQILTQSSNRI